MPNNFFEFELSYKVSYAICADANFKSLWDIFPEALLLFEDKINGIPVSTKSLIQSLQLGYSGVISC